MCQVFAKVEAQLALVEASVSVQAFPHGRSSRKARPLKRKAFDAISEIQNEVQKMPKKLPKPMKDRYHTLSTNIAKFSNISEAYMPHKWVTKPMDVKGVRTAPPARRSDRRPLPLRASRQACSSRTCRTLARLRTSSVSAGRTGSRRPRSPSRSSLTTSDTRRREGRPQ